jgi:phosphohistidine phosphatase
MRAAPVWPTMGAMDGTGRLIVMRHAKAGELPGGPDFERALRQRGRTDAAAAGRWLRGHGYRPDLVLCSAARRTRQTWQYVSQALGSEVPMEPERRLYHADAADVMDVLRETDQAVGTLMYVGHNPAAAELVAALTGTEPDFPTAAIAVLAISGEWAGLGPGDGELEASWTPAQGREAG